MLEYRKNKTQNLLKQRRCLTCSIPLGLHPKPSLTKKVIPSFLIVNPWNMRNICGSTPGMLQNTEHNTNMQPKKRKMRNMRTVNGKKWKIEKGGFVMFNQNVFKGNAQYIRFWGGTLELVEHGKFPLGIEHIEHFPNFKHF